MSKEFRNIEDLFKDSFENAKVTPNKEIWDNIENNLRSESYFHNKFKSYFVQPSNKIWTNIQRKLFYLNFFRFSLQRFNVYYLSSIIALLLLIYNYSGNNNQQNIYPSTSLQNFENNNKGTRNIKIKKTNNNFIAEVPNTKHSAILIKSQPNNNNYNKTAANTTTTQTDKTGTLPEKTEPVTSNNRTNITNNNIENIIDTKNTITETNKQNLPAQTTLQTYNKKVETIATKKAGLITLSPYITHPVLPYKDTLGVNVFGEPIVVDITKWSFDIIWSPLVTNSNIETNNFENEQYITEYNNALSPALSHSFGINTNFEYKNLIIQSGIYYHQFKENFKYNEPVLLVDTINYYETYYTYEPVVDTTYILDLDEWLNNNNVVYIEYIDTNIVKTPNQRQLTEYDTTYTSKQIIAKNKYTYVEIPLTVGYQFKNDKLTIAPKMGLITGLYINSSGKILNNSYQTSDLAYNKQEYIKAHFSAYSSIEIRYKLNDFFSVIADPYYRKSLNSIFNKTNNISYKFGSYGLKLGIRYKF